MMETFEVS